jgi:F-type H+-transporting ATPase subunit delta
MRACDRVLSRRYAQALLLAAGEKGAEDSTASELEACARLLEGSREEMLHPGIPAERKRDRMRALVGSAASGPVLGLLDLLAANKRLALLHRIREDYGFLLDRSRGILRARVSSAEPLLGRDLSDLEAALGGFFSKTVRAEVRSDPGLLAGVVVRAGDWVLDGSLRGRLRRLRGSLAAEEF